MDIDFGFWMIMAGLAGIAGVIALAFHFLRKRPKAETESFGPGGYRPYDKAAANLGAANLGAAELAWGAAMAAQHQQWASTHKHVAAGTRLTPHTHYVTPVETIRTTTSESSSGSDFLTGAVLGAVAAEVFSGSSDNSSSFDSGSSGSSDSSSGFSGFDSGSSGGGGASSDW